MKTLSQHNKDNNPFDEKPDFAGVLCDKCSGELIYSDDTILDSYPAYRSVHCPLCGFKGSKIV